MKRLICEILLVIGFSSVGLSFNLIQTDNAQKYLREAQQYNEKAEKYEREAEQLTKKANDYTRQADRYAKKKDFSQSRLYSNWANDALSKAQTRMRWAKEDIKRHK